MSSISQPLAAKELAMPHPVISKRYPHMTTRNETETILGNCCLCQSPLIRVDYEWWMRSERYHSGFWEASHEVNTAFEGATHCCNCEDELRKARNVIVKRQRVNFVERDGTVSTELITRAPLHPNWKAYFRSVGMLAIK